MTILVVAFVTLSVALTIAIFGNRDPATGVAIFGKRDPATGPAARHTGYVFDMHARAAGRIAFGLVLLLGTGMLVHASLTMRDPGAAQILLLTWLGAFGAAGIAKLFVDGNSRGELSRGYFVASVVIPTVGAALLLPLSIHAVVATVLGLDGFDDWVRISLVVSGAAHIVFATLAAARAYHLAIGREPVSTARIFATTVVVSCIPFVLMLGLPPLIVTATGVVIAPLLERMPRVIDRARVEASMPTAIAHYRAA